MSESPSDIETFVFDLSNVDWARVPSLLRAAPNEKPGWKSFFRRFWSRLNRKEVPSNAPLRPFLNRYVQEARELRDPVAGFQSSI
ncbi:hypothetical protein [Pseudofrankia inefficax]|uniref:Uncharacterized protein n=1 Tax=Pseudofrankia inefficax (strain DSM 45817 / CECT 9037 / DDB 130130 / EuI1c) TaxID=298654 RepID=E3IXA0_PSEI1|nr:hypothetical protein [Pseudofrankia inefficax]ADP85000.1 hypothetical protein FraEuI1c_7033 [Pseudofrankia inefficax]